GYCAASAASPVGSAMAAVTATRSGRSRANDTSSAEKTEVQDGGGLAGTPVAEADAGTDAETDCMRAATSCPAGGSPRPLLVQPGTAAGPDAPRAWRSSASTAAMS